MVRSGVDLQLLAHRPSEAVLGQHALDSALDDGLWPTLDEVLEGLFLDSTRKTRVAVVDLLGALARRHRHLLGVDDDDEVTTVDVRSKRRLVLAADDLGDLGGESTQR